jgi:hypothetical protein
VLIGQPVENCERGNNQTVKTVLGGTFELEQSFSLEQTFSVSLGVYGITLTSSTAAIWGEVEKITKSQEIEVPIPPQRVVSLFALDLSNSRVTYHAY